MAVYQGSLTVKRRPKDGMPGIPGTQGSSGPIPIQKEWVVGDTHMNNESVKDFIYVRGSSKNTSYWYTRIAEGDVVAGAAPVGGANVEGYTRVDWMRNLALMFLLAEEANLANFIFKDNKLISIRGTVNGVETNYSGQANFKPYIIIDGKTGKIYAEGAEISGIIKALAGEIGHFAIVDGKLTANYSYMTYLPSGAYVEVTSDIQLTSGGIIISNSYGGTVDHPQIIEWNVEITSTGVKVGDYEIRRTGFFEFGNKIEMGSGDYIHPASHPASMITGGTFPEIVKANNNSSYTTKQIRNVILSTGNAVSSQMANGDIWIKYE